MSVLSCSIRKPGRQTILFCLLLCMPVIIPGTLFAGNGIEGARAAGMGTAFIAVADDPSALSFNPAGITQLTGTQMYGGGTLIVPSTSYKSPSGQSEQTGSQVFFPPYNYICSDLGTKDLRVGFGLSSPFGIGGREWSSTGLTRYQSVDSSITTVTLNPTIAYRLLPNLSIAAGVDYLMAWTDADAMVNQSPVGAGDGKMQVSGHGSGWGYNVGLLFAPAPRWSLGFQYRSSITVNYEGSLSLSGSAPPLQPAFGGSTFRSAIRTTNTFPDVLGFGVAFRPTSKWTIALDAERYGWSSFGMVTTEVERKVPAAGITDQQTLLNWRDSLILRTGAEYRPTDRLSLRAGYCYVPTYVSNNTLNPSNPDSNQHVGSVGLGYKIETIDLDFFYAAGFYGDRRVENEILSGRYETFVHYFGFAVGKRF